MTESQVIDRLVQLLSNDPEFIRRVVIAMWKVPTSYMTTVRIDELLPDPSRVRECKDVGQKESTPDAPR